MKDRKCVCEHYESRHEAEDRGGWPGSGMCQHERCDCLIFESIDEREASRRRDEEAVIAGEARYRQSVLADEVA